MTGSRHPISLAAGVLPEFSPQETARAAAAAGYDATGVWVDTAIWTDATTREMRAILADTGLPALDVEVIWLQPGPLADAHRRVIEIGRAIGARHALVVSSDPDDGGTAAKLADLCELAGDDLRVSLEFGLFTEVRTIKQAAAIAARVDHPAIAVLVDPIHLHRSGGTPADVAALDPRLFPYAQYCDAAPIGFDLADRAAIIRDAVDERLLPGDGILPLPAVLEALPHAVPLSIELRSKTLRDGYADPVARARAVAEATRDDLARA
ncbi:sugar phosphate isomerase/epimerase family protein [Sphingomonas oryzagri]|uniref:Sugar phosphate isomerase/epimerase n=1 Tax=Sphingomonas oryzagri TaxID=3042314 RepID=A0ABT6MWK2_9SPHN|nr:sugar phosphate isomerase/epimerase [Sphingomonas oryzagri]MDH7637425.1 sugar phosphate isomerase/epimerase [Sphingomonas oryzagri]